MVEMFGGVMRVDGRLAVSRSFGDADIKGVVAEPHVTLVSVEEGKEHFVISATDGLWDVMGNEEAVRLAAEVVNDEGGFQVAAERLTLEAWVRGSTDNIAVLVVKL